MTAKRLPRGTTQAYLADDGDYYFIEKWNGQRWVRQEGITWGSKREADKWGFANLPRHKA